LGTDPVELVASSVKIILAIYPRGVVAEIGGPLRKGKELDRHGTLLSVQAFHRDTLLLTAPKSYRQMHLGVGVPNQCTRHPAVIVCGAGAFQEACQGRQSPGIGYGNRRELLLRWVYGKTGCRRKRGIRGGPQSPRHHGGTREVAEVSFLGGLDEMADRVTKVVDKATDGGVVLSHVRSDLTGDGDDMFRLARDVMPRLC
jgi:hypothetical protein